MTYIVKVNWGEIISEGPFIIYGSAFIPVILQLKWIFHKGFHLIVTRSYVPWTRLNTNICALFHQYIEYFQPAPQNWCRANGSVAFCVFKVNNPEKASKRSIFQTFREIHSCTFLFLFKLETSIFGYLLIF